jgi:raffinose/stachyose/melibiose transport system permease protein
MIAAKRRKHLGLLIDIVLFIVFLVMVVPFLWLIVSSLRPNMELFREPFSFPRTISLNNYTAVFESHPIGTYFLNTVFVAVMAMILTVTISALASYAFMYRFRGMSRLAGFLAIGLFIPTNAFLVPYYVMVNSIGLYDRLFGLALVYTGVNLPQSIMIIKSYMGTIPRSLLESARIDGAGSLQTLLRIVVPISVPGIVTSCIFIVINSWNELLFANLLSQSDISRTIQVAIRSFLTTFSANYAYAFAAMVISIFPTIVIYAFLTEKIIGGMTAGAVKG